MKTLLDTDSSSDTEALPASLPALLSLTDQELLSIEKHLAQGLLVKCMNDHAKQRDRDAQRVSLLLERLRDRRDLISHDGIDQLIGLSDTVMEEQIEGKIEQVGKLFECMRKRTNKLI